jgi:ankyrin repeat protein
VSVIEKVDAVRKDLAKLLVSEVEKGSILSVQFLLKTYPDVIDCQIPYNGRNSTALSVACQKGNVEMVKLLLKHKASVNITDREDKKDKKEAWYNEFSLEEDFNPKSEELNQPVHHAALG